MTRVKPTEADRGGSEALRTAVAAWARSRAAETETLLRVGINERTTGLGGHGHVDIVIVVSETELPPAERPSAWNPNDVPVATQALVYTSEELDRLLSSGSWPARQIEEDIRWVFER